MNSTQIPLPRLAAKAGLSRPPQNEQPPEIDTPEQMAFVRLLAKAHNVQAVFVVRGCVLMRRCVAANDIAA